MPDVPLSARLLLLVLVLGCVAAIDRWRKGPQATKWREYAFLLFAAASGGVFGAGIDQVSLTISPEYFELAKGIERGAGFRLEVTKLGFHAGFVAGALGAGVLLIMNNPRPDRPPLRYGQLVGQIPCVLGCALVCAVPGVILWPHVAPELALGLEPEAEGGFITVWGFHVGLYAGAAIGLVWAAWRVRVKRVAAAAMAAAAALAPAPPTPAAEPASTPDAPPPSPDLAESDR